jgi:hypothetical protein
MVTKKEVKEVMSNDLQVAQQYCTNNGTEDEFKKSVQNCMGLSFWVGYLIL